MKRLLSFALWLFCLFGVAALSSAPNTAPRPPQRTEPAQLHLGPPLARIGEADGEPEYLLSKVGGVQLLDNRIVIADNASAQLRFYDGRGRFQKRIGRRGSGPAEFGWLKLVPNWSSDSLVVFDRGLNRINFISASGEFGRSVQLPKLAAGTMLTARHDFLGIDREGSLLFQSQSGASPRAPGMFRRVVTVTRLGPGATTQVVGSFKGDEILYKPVNGRPTFSPLPFLQHFVSALGRDRLFYIEGPGSGVTGHTIGTFASQTRTIVFQAARLSREDYETWYEKQLLTAPSPAREATRQFYRELYAPWTMQPVSRMVVDNNGRIWIEEFSLTGSTRAAVYSPRFELLGIVTLPPAFAIQSVRGNLVAGVVTDEDGVERVEVRPLIGL